MSKRQLNSRIKSLFTELGEETQAIQPRKDILLGGWTWEADARGEYTSVSAESTQYLGYPSDYYVGKSLTEGLSPETAQALEQALNSDHFPVDLQVHYTTLSGNHLPSRVQIYPVPWQPDHPFQRDLIHGWRAIVSPISDNILASSPVSIRPNTQTKSIKKQRSKKDKSSLPDSHEKAPRHIPWLSLKPVEPIGYQAQNHHLQPTQEILTDLGLKSLDEQQVISRPANEDKPAVLAVSKPLADGESSLLLELLDDEPGRKWNDAERMLVEQVVDQMSLALENAQLFQQTQNALAETSALYAASAAFSAAQSYNDVLESLRRYTILEKADRILAIHYFDHPWTENQPAESCEILSGWTENLDLLPSDLRQLRIQLTNHPDEASILTSDQISILNDLARTETRQEILITYRNQIRVNNLALIPLITGGQWLGFISAGYSTPIQYSPEDNRRLMVLSGQAAITINNLHLLAETRQRNLELAAINSVIAAASQSLALEEMLNEVLERVLDTVGYSAGLVTLVDSYGELIIGVQRKMPVDYMEWLEKFGVDGSLSQLVYKQRKPIKVGDLLVNAPVDVTSLLHFGLRSFMGVPLESKGLVLGTISVFGDQPKLGDESRLQLLQAIGQQVAVAVENASLFKEAQKRSAELAVVNRVVTAVSGSKDLQTSLRIITSELGKNLHVQTGIALLNEDRQVMTVVASYSPNPDTPDGIGVELPIEGNPSTQQVLATKKTLVIVDAQHNPLTAPIHEEMRLRSIQSLMLIPLSSGNRVIGTVGLDILEPSREFTPDEIRLAETIVLQASTAIQNTRLFEQTEQALAETETLYKASAEFNEAESYTKVLEILRRYTMIGRNNATNLLALFEEAQAIGYGQLTIPEWFVPIASWTSTPLELFPFSRTSIQDLPAAGELMKPDAPSIIFDVENDLRLDYRARQIYTQQYQANSVLYAPVVAGGRWIGFLASFFSNAEALSNPDIRRLMVLVGQASVAIQNIRLLEESRRRADQLQTAAEIARDTSSTLALDALLLRVVNLLCDRFRYDHASVFLIDDDGLYAMVREATGEAGAEMKRKGHKLGVGSQSVIGTVTRNGLPLVVNDVSQNPVHRPNPLLPNTRAELGIPLKIGQRVIGALDVQSNEINAFTTDDVAVLQVLADQIAVAVDNARAYMISQQAVAEMREVDRLKSQFLANMSHELRTPLNSIIGFSRVILKGIDGPLTELQEQDLSAIYNSGQHLLNLINDVLDLSKIEAGKMELSFEEKVNLMDLINSVMSTVVGLVKDKPIQLSRDIAPDLPLVRADPIKIRQVLINLFSNAAKFTDQGTIGIKVFKQTGQDGKPEVMIQVSDTGSGIAIEHQAKLFQPFSQVDDSLTRKTGGTGLGLSICRHLVEMHGGKIGLESEIGAGSTFYFTIPIQIPGTASLDGTDAKLVLVIDDERPIVQLYERYLNRHGYRVIGLSDSSDAVRRAREVLPYAILLDVMMPGRDGWHVLQDLKSDPDTQSIPVIMCTILESQAKGESLGANGYLTKPILEEELVRMLSNLEAKPHRYTILGITDNDHEFERFQAVFKDEHDYQLGLAFGSHQAISAIQYRRPDAILLAVDRVKRKATHPLNGLNVVSLLETIRNDPKLDKVPVIILADLPLDIQHSARIQELASIILPKSEWSKGTVLQSIQQIVNDHVPAR